MEAFGKAEYLSLFDDMAPARMNSLPICPKWSTTGYRSRLPFLDQQPSNKVIASENELLRWAPAEARKRGIKVWFSAFVTGFDLGPSVQVAGYTTSAHRASVRAKGFGGDLAMICETARTSYTITQEVNTREYRQKMPGWSAVTYEYDKWDHRYAMMDVCIEQPQRDGLRVYYLPRGAMTWGSKWPLPISLEQSWAMEVEDVLREAGYRDGVAARRALLAKISGLGDVMP